MSQTVARFAGCVAMLAALILAPPALAGTAKSQSPLAKAKSFEKQCSKSKRGHAASKCVSALRKLASGKSSSPRTACAGLSRKATKRKGKSPYARCVSAGAKLVKERKASAARDDDADESDESDDADDADDAGEGPADPGDDEPDDPLAGGLLDGGVDDDLTDFGPALDPDFP